MAQNDARSSGEYVILREDDIEEPGPNDLIVLEALRSSFDSTNSGHISFQGIKRKLGIHQETLARSLHRLERDGFVVKDRREYAVSQKGEEVISRHAGRGSDGTESYSIPILRTMLPVDTNNADLEESLSHKWFGDLRWFGSSKTEEETILTWITQDGKMKLKAKISEGYLSIESEAISAKARSDAVKAAYSIFHQISEIVRQPKAVSAKEVYRAS
jgi:DNA-binding PadR family transcriptional regulator